MKMEDKMAKLFSCKTSTISVKSESIGTTKASSSSTLLGKRPRVTTPTVIVIEDDDDDNDAQRSLFSSYTLGSKQELLLCIEESAVFTIRIKQRST